MKRWKIHEYDPAEVRSMAARCDLSPLTLKVLNSRGYRELEAVAELFTDNGLADPFTITDMQKAADAVNEAVDNNELICIYGDYDCDGVTATTILYSYLMTLGANVMYYIPERSDGYGMSIAAVEALAQKGVRLILTVDNGISAIAEAERIYELGMKLVVTDHHQPGETLPRAEAVVDPHRADCTSEYKDLCGAGVALKLCIALNDGEADPILEQYADICALGTVADVVPLTGENRTIVKTGLGYMKNTENFGLDLIMEKSGLRRDELNTGSISFGIAPRINASGRFGSPLTAVKALLAEDADEAEVYVDQMMTLNEQRRSTELEILKDILQHIDRDPGLLDHRVLVIAGEGWHLGVIGIVAAKLLERFGKPTILISTDENGVLRGSARSVKGFNIFECLTTVADLLDHFGGHECAAGMTLLPENFNEFRDRVYKYAAELETMPTLTVDCDLCLEPADLTVDNVKGLSALEPFGTDNARPVFALRNAEVLKVMPLSNGRHTKLELSCGGAVIQAPMFGAETATVGIRPRDRLDLAVTLEINEFNNRQSVSARVVDYRPSGVDQDRYFNARDTYERYKNGEELPQTYLKRMIPERSELVAVYKLLSAVKQAGIDELYLKARNASMNYCKLRLILDAFAETGLAGISAASQRVTILPVSGKVELENAPVLAALRSKLR